MEFIHSDYLVDTIFYTENTLPKLGILSQNIKLYEISTAELSKISSLTTAQHVVSLIKIPQRKDITTKMLKGSFTLALDGIQDPGNLGTIIRTADWFGFKYILCSADTVDVYNSKVVQATMGSLSRVQVSYTDLRAFLKNSAIPVYGALLNGRSVYDTDFGAEGIIVMGNEGSGISEEIMKLIIYPVTIPRFGKAESLNVAISASVFYSEIRRNS